MFILSNCYSPPKDYQEYYSNGWRVYKNHCQKCHGKKGEGWQQLYPPLKRLKNNKKLFAQIPCIVYYGIQKSAVEMPAMNYLTPSDIAYLMTYLAAHYLEKDTLITTAAIEERLQRCFKEKP